MTLSRALRMRSFDLSLDGEGAPIRASGRVDGDSVLVLAIDAGTDKVDSQRVALSGPILLPTLVPLAVALTRDPKVGKHYVLPVFDPARMAPRDVRTRRSRRIALRRERQRGVRLDDRRAGTACCPTPCAPGDVAADSGGGFSGWIDEQGRIVETTQLGFDLRRMPYEVAFENWRNDSTRVDGHRRPRHPRDDGDRGEQANGQSTSTRCAFDCPGVSLGGFDLNGAAAAIVGDTLIVTSAARQRAGRRRRSSRIASATARTRCRSR